MNIARQEPIVDQVYRMLRQRIRDLVYPPGGRIPAESELANELGVSRATVRTVLAKLAGEGFVIRKQGDGTYVNEHIRDVDTRYGGLWDFSRIIAASGYTPTIKAVRIEQRNPAKAEAEALNLGDSDAVLSLERLFMADDKPAIYACNVIPRQYVPVAISKINGEIPLHQLIRNYCDCVISYAISDVSATMLTDEQLAMFGHALDYPIIELTETFYSKDNQPLAFGRSFFDHTVLRLRLVQAWG